MASAASWRHRYAGWKRHRTRQGPIEDKSVSSRWVEFYDIVKYAGQDTVVFAGRERGEFARDGRTIPLAIRTSRVFQYFGGRQVHHHGSIDDPEALARYQRAVREV